MESEIIVGIVSSLIGGFFTLAGIFLQHYLKKERPKKENTLFKIFLKDIKDIYMLSLIHI